MSPSELQELDRAQTDGRARLLRSYERSVSESMESLAWTFAIALQRDLVGADDFTPRRRQPS